MTLTKSPAPSKDAERGVPIAESGPKFAGTDVAVETLFHCLDGGESMDAFLKDFPAVSRAQAVAALRDEARAGMGAAVRCDPRIMDGGIPRERDLSQNDVAVILVRAKSNRFQYLRPLIPQIQDRVFAVRRGEIAHVNA